MLKHDILTTAITTIETNAEDLEAEGMPEAAEDLRTAAAQLEGLLSSYLLEGPVQPKAPATLPAKIVLRQTKPDEWATHMAVLQESGVWSTTWGHYFPSLALAAIDFGDRCRSLTGERRLVDVLDELVSFCEDTRELTTTRSTGRKLVQELKR
jgi:hypothetical protein